MDADVRLCHGLRGSGLLERWPILRVGLREDELADELADEVAQLGCALMSCSEYWAQVGLFGPNIGLTCSNGRPDWTPPGLSKANRADRERAVI
jgi:hypothetical protein